MKIQSLNGQWTLLSADDQSFSVPAQVPGVVHTALIEQEIIPDPFYRDNEKLQFWVGETDWIYTRQFNVDSALMSHQHVLLRCHGIDTIATIAINGQELASTENMYRTYEFDVKDFLKSGDNSLSITFASPMKYSRQQEAERGILPTWSVGDHRINGGNYIRKEPSNFGWDWGPMLVTSGIWKEIELVAFDTARISDVQILQDHSANKVDLTLNLAVERLNDTAITALVRVSDGSSVVAEASAEIKQNKSQLRLQIDNPRLWWIAGMGEQPLYQVEIILQSDSQELDKVKKQIGLRTLQLDRHADEWGESFQFTINGIPFFAKGANWIPGDVFVSRMSRADYEKMIHPALDANMNMLRVWGGGIYESEDFYDICDELGIAVWQDCIFACGTYPTYDADFMANVRAEAVDNMRRLHHRASLALWCGNNEIEQGLAGPEWTARTMSWEDYGKLFDDLLAEVAREVSPQTDYWPGSPHSPSPDRDWRDPSCGDVHLWAVWHGREPFEWYRTNLHRFVSEFGFQSFPEPKITAEYASAEDQNITSYVMEYHQRSGIGNSTIIHYMLDWFRLPDSFEKLIWLSQIQQGMAMKYAVEHWRRNMPRTMGTLYWQLNDLWGGPTWSSLDWRGNWKALHYMTKNFYAPLLISGVEDSKNYRVDIHVTSDANESTTATIRWQLITVDGESLLNDELSVTIPARSSHCIFVVDVKELVEKQGSRNVLVWLELLVDNQVVSDNLVLFERPKHMELSKQGISTKLESNSDGTQVLVLSSDDPALWVWIESDVEGITYSDNFFHLVPHQARRIRIQSDSPIQTSELKIQSLVDTY